MIVTIYITKQLFHSYIEMIMSSKNISVINNFFTTSDFKKLTMIFRAYLSLKFLYESYYILYRSYRCF